MNSPELKPCPFCLGKAEAFYIANHEGGLARCADADCIGNRAYGKVSAWNRRADLAAVPAQVRVKPLVFDWRKDEDSPNPSCWRADGDGFFAYVLIPFEPNSDPHRGFGQWNANPNHRGQTGFSSREHAMAYCETTIRDQAEEELRLAAQAIATWAIEPQSDPRDEVIALAITACRIIDDAVKEGYDTVNGLMMHLLEAVEPARAALAAAKSVQHG